MPTPATATPTNTKAADPTPDSLDAELTPENRVAYRQAKLALAQAEAAFEMASRAAEEEAGKPQRDFDSAKTAYEAADKKLTKLVEDADAKLNDLSKLAGNANAKVLLDRTNPDEAAKLTAKLQEALDAYKACAASVAAQVQALDDAILSLRKLSQPEKGEFKPESARLSETATQLAQQQKELALAQAEIPLEAARDAFDLKKAELEGSRPRRLQ